MTDINTLYLTFNCGRALINTDFFAASITKGLEKQVLPPDLIVLSLQEIAPIGYSFLGGSFISPYFERFTQAVQKAAQSYNHDEQYEVLLASNVGMTALMLFATPEVARKVNRVETAGVGVGVWEMGNKGAVGARLGYAPEDGPEVDMTFVAAHLAPHESGWQRRNLDWRSINGNLVFTNVSEAEASRTKLANAATEDTEPLLSSATDDQTIKPSKSNDHGLMISNSYIFFGGDLNYRTSDMSPDPENHKSWPQPNLPPSSPQHYTSLLPNDQLAREKSAGRTLHGLTEAPIKFEPSYKYSSKAQERAQRTAASLAKKAQSPSETVIDIPDEEHWDWASHRHPSWCDRVLYLPSTDSSKMRILTYTTLPLQPSSDHKPVLLHVSIPATPARLDTSAPYPIRPGWEARRATARRWELIVGVLSYLGLTWEGRALLVGTILAALGGWAALRSLLAF